MRYLISFSKFLFFSFLSFFFFFFLREVVRVNYVVCNQESHPIKIPIVVV